MGEACAECTQNCNLMHKMDKNPSPLVSSFFRIIYGDNHSEVLFLPPRFAREVQNFVGKETQLEDFNGEKWTVKLTRVDGLLAFQDGWDKFYKEHGLQKGDILLFHYIVGSHYVVSMYGISGCPENRHFGHHKGKKVRKERNSEKGCREIGHFGLKKKRIRTKENSIDNDHGKSKIASCSRSKTSVSDQETTQRFEPLVTNKSPSPSQRLDNGITVRETHEPFAMVVCETPEPFAMVVREASSPFVVEPFCLFDRDVGNVEEEYRSGCLHDLASFEMPKKKSDVDFFVKIQNGNVLETRFDESGKNRKEKEVMPNEPMCRSTVERTGTPPSFRQFDFPVTSTKVAKKELALESETNTSDERSAKKMEMAKKELAGTSNKYDMVEGSRVTMPKLAKRELVTETSDERSGNIKYKPTNVTKNELKKTHGLDIANEMRYGSKSRDTNVDGHNRLSSLKKESVDFEVVKEEPFDFDEASPPPPHVPDFSCRVVMERYEYLELPKDFGSHIHGRSKLRSKVILVRGGTDLRPRPILYQKECGVSALTKGWGAFAKAKGLRPGDKCEFVLENAPQSMFTETMFRLRLVLR